MAGVKRGRGRKRGNLGPRSRARGAREEEKIGNACKEAIVFSVFYSIRSGRSRPSDKGGPGHPDPEIRGRGGGVKKSFFRPQFGLKIRGERPPGPLPWVRH